MQFFETIKPKVSVVCDQETCCEKSLCPKRTVLLTGDDITIHSFSLKDIKHAEIHISSVSEETKEIIRSLFGTTWNEDSYLIKDFKTVVTNEEIGTFREITLYRCNFETYNFALFEPDDINYTDTVEISFEAYDID